MLIGTDNYSKGETFPSKFENLLTFSLFYKFIQTRKHYLYNIKIPRDLRKYFIVGKMVEYRMQIEKCLFWSPQYVEKYYCYSEPRECMLNSCDECKHHGLTVDEVENGEANKGDSDSDSETNRVRYYQWKRGDDGYLTSWWSRLMPMKPWVCGSQWWKRWRSTFTISGGSLKRFAALQIVWPWRKFWFTSIIAKTINLSIRTKSKTHISATNHLAFLLLARIIKMVKSQLQLPPRTVISREFIVIVCQ